MAKTVITIETEDNSKGIIKTPFINAETITTETKLKSKKKRANRIHLWVDEEELLYKIAGAGLLNKIHGVNFIDGKKMYFFDKDDNVKEIIEKYYTDKYAENKENVN